jgi:dihydrofolate reductase
MGNLIYSMTSSLDGYIAGPGGDIGFSAPEDELFRFHTELVSELGGHLLGRRLYETMVYWETADQDPAASEMIVEFARIWQALPKVVFSRSLEAVEGNTTLVRDGLGEEVARLKAQDGKDLGVGGADLAGACARLGLIDEYRVFVCPVLLGAGTPLFQALENRIELELVETRTFSSGVVYLRYRLVK